MISANIVGGLAGAVTVTALNETFRQFFPKAPQLQLLGIRAVRSLIQKTDKVDTPDRSTQYDLAMGGDLMANGTYYAMAGGSYVAGGMLGLAAGLGGIYLPGPLGLGEAPTNRTKTTQVLTIGYYLAGGLVAAAVNRAVKRKLG
jgi:hypothetical protein